MEILAVLLRKELRILVRARGVSMAVLLFAVVSTVLAAFGSRELGLGQRELHGLAAPLFWLTFFFSAVQGLLHTHRAEEESRAFATMLRAPMDPVFLFIAKLLANIGFIVIVQLVALFLIALFFDLPLGAALVDGGAVMILAAVGFAALGTVLAGVTAATGGGDLLLPLLLFPLALPLFLAGIALLRELFMNGAVPWSSSWFVLLAVFDIVALCLGAVLYDQVGRE